jgi:hypothetical protein
MSPVRKFLVVLALASLLTACGSVARRVPQPGTSPVTITVAMDGQSVYLNPYQIVEVQLRQQPGFGPWSPVASSRGLLTPVAETKATPVRGMTLARFRADEKGSTQLTSTASPLCSPGSACAQIVRLFRVTVIVG